MTKPVLSVKNLTTHFFTRAGVVKAVDGVSFDLAKGEIMGLVGESGSGKSVTAKSLMYLNAPNANYADESKILLNTEDVSLDVLKLTTQKQRNVVRGGAISMIFQEPMASFAPAISIGKQMVEQLLLHTDMSKAQCKELSIEMLDRVGISDASSRFNQYAFELSGGMRQRAMIAMALSTKPKLLIADEPTTALDVTIEAQIIDLLKELRTKLNMSIILITHNFGIVDEFADDIAVMFRGEIVESGPAESVLAKPQHPYTKALIKCIPKMGAKLKRLPVVDYASLEGCGV